jgi:hypothetical protein
MGSIDSHDISVRSSTPASSPIACVLLDKIRAAQARGSDLKQISKEAKVDHTSLSRFVNDQRGLNLDNIGALCSHFNLHVILSSDCIKNKREKIDDLFDKLRGERPEGVRLRRLIVALIQGAREWSKTSLRAIKEWSGVPASSLSEFLRQDTYDLSLKSAEGIFRHFQLILVTVDGEAVAAQNKIDVIDVSVNMYVNGSAEITIVLITGITGTTVNADAVAIAALAAASRSLIGDSEQICGESEPRKPFHSSYGRTAA